MKNTLSLNGSWQLIGLHEGAANWASPNALAPEGSEIIMAQVPGEVHVDLLRAGKIPDPYEGANVEEAHWVERQEWWYKRNFEVENDFLQKQTCLEFDGLDTLATIYLNGEEVGRAENMFIPHRFDVTEKMSLGRNTVAVRFDPIRSDCVRKMRTSFGSKTSPRLVGAGIWRDVNLVSYDVLSIKNVHVETDIEGAQANAWIYIEIENHTDDDQPVAASVVVSKGDSREKIEVTDWVSPFGGVVEAVVRIEEPELWWPNGMGEASLYNCMVGITCEDDVQDVAVTDFGVRELRFIESKNSALFVNGENVFIKGAKWMPADLLVSNVTDEHCRELVRLAKDANLNALHVTGSGIYERPAFYEACDELGIMVFQDFMFACPNGQEIESIIADEAHEVAKNLRNHPSIVAWCAREMGEAIQNALRSLDRTRQLLPSQAAFTTVSDRDSIAHSEILQGEWTKDQIESIRRKKADVPGIMLPLFNDSHPETSSSLVDYYLRPKAAYYYSKRALAPVIVSFAQLDDRVQVHITTDDRIHSIHGKLQVGVMTFDTCELDVKDISVEIEPNSSKMVWESESLDILLVDAKNQCLIALLETRKEIIAKNVYFARSVAEVEFPKPKLLVHREQLSETTHELVVSADAFARNIVISNLPVGARPSDNYFDVLPGEHKTVTIHNLKVEQANDLKLGVLGK